MGPAHLLYRKVSLDMRREGNIRRNAVPLARIIVSPTRKRGYSVVLPRLRVGLTL